MKDFMKRIPTNPWIELAFRWILGLIFAFASLHKIADPADFAKIIYGYDLFPMASINLIAITIPFIELICGAALLLGLWSRAAALSIMGLLFAFIIALSINLFRGHVFDCGCFSIGVKTSTEELLVRDIILFIMGWLIFGYKAPRKWALTRS